MDTLGRLLLAAALAVSTSAGCAGESPRLADGQVGDLAARDGARREGGGPSDRGASVDGDGPDTTDHGTPPAVDGPPSPADQGAPSDGKPPCSKRSRKTFKTPSLGASWRFGGGYGYPDTVDPSWCRTTVVSTTAQLEAALKSAGAGDTVYVKDGAELDLTGKSLCISKGVWLAGGRGRGGGPGALLYTHTRSKTPMLRACGTDTRLTGLRLWGADPAECPPEYALGTCSGVDKTGGVNCRDCEPATYGISAPSGQHRLEVDNCELAGFSFAAITLNGSADHHIHHNHLHHTQRQGLGYGVVLGGLTSSTCSALIEHNRFDYYRHAVAASGGPAQDYVARDNLTLSHTIGHVYDMHGLDEKLHNGDPTAGRRMEIYDNRILSATHYSFVLRGRPVTGAWFYGNCTARSSSKAVLQRFFFGKLTLDKTPAGAAASNTYGASFDSCLARRFCYERGGVGPRRHGLASTLSLADVAVGDFDGDGKDDLFRSASGSWYWSRSASGAWAKLNSSGYALSALRFGDFDGDGKTDVFHSSSSGWMVSYGGAGKWTQLNSLKDAVAGLRFADFDGDGKTDVFKSAGGVWYWSRSGSAPWAKRNASSVALSSLRFGDFDGDGKTDVFRSAGGAWYLSSAAQSGWKKINSSNTAVTSMRFGDLDGDGKTDVLISSAQHWSVSWGGASGWKRLRVDSTPISALILGDFDGDGRDDVLRAGCR